MNNLTKTDLQIIQTLLSEDIDNLSNSNHFNDIRIKNIKSVKLTPSKQKKLDEFLEYKNNINEELVKKVSTYIKVRELLNQSININKN